MNKNNHSPLASPSGRSARFCLGVALFCVIIAAANTAPAQRRIRDIARVKGQEENTLIGHGLVVGLNGTGDTNFLSQSRALSRMLYNMGHPLPQDINGQELLAELQESKNVAVVMVTATVPAAGARQGDKLNCVIKAYGNASDLKGGYLISTFLTGIEPAADPSSRRVYAVAQGQINVENPELPVSGVIHDGCRMEESFNNEFTQQNFVTLVLEKNHATFRMAQDIADAVNRRWNFETDPLGNVSNELAKALDQVNVVVRIPAANVDYPVEFISDLLDIRLIDAQNDARVVINERTGTIIIGANVEIAPVAVAHKEFTIEAGGPFFALDPTARSSEGNFETVKLKSLVDALNTLKASPQDIIDIIKGLKRNGDLYGDLIVE